MDINANYNTTLHVDSKHDNRTSHVDLSSCNNCGLHVDLNFTWT